MLTSGQTTRADFHTMRPLLSYRCNCFATPPPGLMAGRFLFLAAEIQTHTLRRPDSSRRMHRNLLIEPGLAVPRANPFCLGFISAPDLPDRLFGETPVQPHLQKYIPSRLPQIKSITRAVSSQARGARDRHERGTGCGGRGCAADEQHVKRTAKSCGSDASTLASSRRESSLRMTVTTKPDHREDHGVDC